jgi:hypothetical protein
LSSAITAICLPDILNQGVFVDGKEINTPHYPYVDDTLMADTGDRIPQAIVASIASCFIIFGIRDDLIRPCPLSLEKLKLYECSPHRRQLGIIIDTNQMTISVPRDKIDKLQHLLQPYHAHRERFNIIKGAELLGNLDHIGSIIPWFRHLYINIRRTFNHCLRDKLKTLKSTDKYKDLLARINTSLTDDSKSMLLHQLTQLQTNFIYSNTLPNEEAYLSPNFKQDIALIRALSTDFNLWHTPIPHIVKRVHPFTAYCDSSSYGAGGYSPELGFMWHLYWPAQTTINDMIDDDTHINIKEFLSIIITFALARRHLHRHPTTARDTYPTIMIKSDNTAAIAWTTKGISSDNRVAHHLSRILCCLQINSTLGLHVDHIAGEENIISDALSRIPVNSRHLPSSSLSFITEQVNLVQQRHSCIQHCVLSPIPPNLLSLISTLLSPQAGRLQINWRNNRGQLTPDLPSFSNGSSLLD